MFRKSFWICAGPFFESNLFFAPVVSASRIAGSEAGAPAPLRLDIVLYDADGEIVNEVRFQPPADRVGILDVEPLMEACKYEGGLKHGTLSVSSTAPFTAFSRVFARQSAAVMDGLMNLSPAGRIFIPLSLAEGKKSLLTVVNYGNERASVKCKLFLARRSPEILCSLPAHGARVLSLEDEFVEQGESLPQNGVQAYLRVNSKTDDPVGIGIIEKFEGIKDNHILTSITGANVTAGGQD